MKLTMPTRAITAAALVERLEQDSASRAHRSERQRERQATAERVQLALAPIFSDLAAVDLDIHALQDLFQSRTVYCKSLPVLIKWLARTDDAVAKEALVRALSLPWARPVATPYLIEEFQSAAPHVTPTLRWAIGNALEVLADEQHVEALVRLAKQCEYGKAREMLALGLGRLKDPRAIETLLGLLDDLEINGHAVIGLGRVKSAAALPYLEKFLDDPRSWVRREAKRSTEKIQKRSP